MTGPRRTFVAFLLFLHFPAAAAELAQRLDAVAAKYFKENEPGAAVLVTRAGTPLLRKGYGLADVEQGTKITPDHVFGLGSITKQFTAVAILQLVESGKVALDDPITKYVPDYPTHGKTITVEHLLTHTSGIVSYTEKSDVRKRRAEELKPSEILDMVRNDPMQFDPGTKWSYNNSGYALLGMILEKVSGMPYAEYLEKNVYPRAGLTGTRYGHTRPIVPGRVPGYGRLNGTIVNADYVSMTIPYAAGALLSTVDDLARWTAAVAAGRVVDRKLVEKAWTPYRLAGGDDTGYGYGWRVAPLAGLRAVQHGGTVHGYSSHAIWLPEPDVFVAVLSNNQSFDPDFLAGLLALEAAGRPWDAAELQWKPEELAAYAGLYLADDKVRRTLIVEDGKLYSQRQGGPRLELFPVAKDQFRFRGSFSTLGFERDTAGNVVSMTLVSGSMRVRAAKSNEQPVTRTAIPVDPAKLDRYTGRYRHANGSVLAIQRKDNGLVGLVGSSQREVELFAESESKWFAKAVDLGLLFTFDERGIAKGLTMLEDGSAHPFEKIE